MTKIGKDPELALIGAGYWGRNLARVFHSLGDLAVICDADQEIMDGFGEEYSSVLKSTNIMDVITDQSVTRVAIATPAATHYELVMQMLRAGKDVFVEKPLCLDIEDGKKIQAACEETNQVLMVGHLLQYHPSIKSLQSLVSDGYLGELYYVTSNRLNLGKVRREENALWSFAPHDISVILSLAGGELPESVRTVGGEYLNKGIADMTLTTMRFKSGMRAQVNVSWLNPFKEQKVTVVGSDGFAVFDDTKDWSHKLVVYKDYIRWEGDEIAQPLVGDFEEINVDETEPLLAECSHFLQCCADRSKPNTDVDEGLRVVQVINAAQASLDMEGDLVQTEEADKEMSLNVRDEQKKSGSEQQYFAHHTATVDGNCEIGSGTKIWHYSHISEDVSIGDRCNFGQNTYVAPGVAIGNNVKVQNNVSIFTGVVVEDDVFFGPSAVLTNVINPRSEIVRKDQYLTTVICKGSTIGANATVVCGVSLGEYCFVAAGGVVTGDVPAYALVAGVPAKRIGWMSRHGHRLVEAEDGLMTCPESGLRYRLTGREKLEPV